MSNDAPAVGKIRLHDAVVPELSAGRYRVTSTLQIRAKKPPAAGSAQTSLGAPPPQQMHVQIDAPRFAIDPGDIAGKHPEVPSRGAFGDRLPHLVLGRRTLPWERRGPNGVPWLALVVAAKSEATLASGPLRTLLPASVVSALEASEPIDGDPTITVLRFAQADVMRAVLPSQADVALLCHVRQVNMADTALAGRDDDGWFAVVTANRLPLAGPAAGTEYQACLVSLEARADVWTAGGQPPPLVVLHAWTFTSVAEGGTIEHLLNHLDVAPFGAAAGGQSLADANGSVALQRQDRLGENSTVRYRGPLRGVSAAALPDAEADISRAAARELGRLLGSADARFLRELVAWHRAAEAEARASLVAAAVSAVVAPPPLRPAGRPDSRAAAKAGAAPVQDVLAALSAALAGWKVPTADLWQVPPGAAAVPARRPRQKRPGTRR
jgi:hypothetical protein